MMAKRRLLACVFLFASVSAMAQSVQKVPVYDRVVDANGAPKKGRVSLFLVAQNTSAVYGPGGLTPQSVSVTALLDTAGRWDAQIYPSAAFSPESYWAVYWHDDKSIKRELVGVYDVPVVVTSTPQPMAIFRVTSADKETRYSFLSQYGASLLTLGAGGSSGPTITSLSPTSALAGSATFTLTVNGANFSVAAAVKWNGNARSTTRINSGQLTVSIPSTDLLASGGGLVSVVDGASVSSAVTFVIESAATTTMPANTIKGNNTGLTAAAANLTATQVRALLGLATTDVPIFSRIKFGSLNSSTAFTAGLAPLGVNATGDVYVDQPRVGFGDFASSIVLDGANKLSVNPAAAYTWTGTHTFSLGTTQQKAAHFTSTALTVNSTFQSSHYTQFTARGRNAGATQTTADWRLYASGLGINGESSFIFRRGSNDTAYEDRLTILDSGGVRLPTATNGAPQDGDAWYDGVFRFRESGVTKTLGSGSGSSYTPDGLQTPRTMTQTAHGLGAVGVMVAVYRDVANLLVKADNSDTGKAATGLVRVIDANTLSEITTPGIYSLPSHGYGTTVVHVLGDTPGTIVPSAGASDGRQRLLEAISTNLVQAYPMPAVVGGGSGGGGSGGAYGAANSVTLSGTTFSLTNDSATPGNNKVYGTDGSGVRGWKNDPAGGAGTVTSVALALPAQFSVSGSPVTTTGTLTAAWASQSANLVFAAPNGSSGTPTFRALATTDLPTHTHAAGDVTSGSLGAVRGGTAQTTWAANEVLVGTGTDTVARKAVPSCSNGATEKLLYNSSTQTFSCGSDQTSGGGSGITTLNSQTGSTQAFANDTNVTITSATNTHTLGWTGTLAAGRLNSNVVQAVTNDTNITGSITGQNLTLAWSGTLAKARQNSATAYNDAANTYSTGAQDFGAATSLKVPTSAGASPTANGLIAYDSTSNTLEYGENGTNRTVVNLDGTQTLTNKTLTTPTIASFTNATHNHTNAAGGGQITDAALSAAVTVAKGGTGVTTLTGLAKGNGTSAFTAAAAGTDYVAPGAITGSGLTMATARLLGRTTASTGAVEEISIGANLTLSGGVLSASGGGGGSYNESNPILDTSSNELLKFTKATTAVNEVTIGNAATGADPTITATGGDTNINLTFTAKGTGQIVFQPPSGGNEISLLLKASGGSNGLQLGTSSGLGGIWPGSVTPNGNNFQILGDATDSYFNSASSGGTLYLRNGNTSALTLSSSVANVLAGRMTFGGTTSSNVALKPSTTTLQVRLGDDSAFGNLSLNNLTVNGTCTGCGGGGGVADPGANGVMVRTALNTTTARTLTGTTNKITITNGDGVSGNPTFTVGADVVQVGQANTYSTGAQDFGAATSFKVPIAAGASPTANGLLAYDSTSNTLEYGENGTNRTLANLDGTQTFTNKTFTAPTISSFTNATHNHSNAAGGGQLAAGSTGDYQINNAGVFGAGVLAQSAGRITATPTLVSSGVAPYLRLITPADTTLTTTAEAVGAWFGGNSSGATVTRQWASGALSQQRENVFVAPTYAFAGASTLTTAATVAISGAPAAGTNATITNPYALWVQGGKSLFKDGLFVAPSASTVPLTLQSAASQTADQLQILTSAGALVGRITALGIFSAEGNAGGAAPTFQFGDSNWRWFRNDYGESGTPAYSFVTTASGASDRQFIWRDSGAAVNRFGSYIGPAAATSGVENTFFITPTIGQSSTAGYTALHVNVTENSTGSGAKRLANFAVGGTAKTVITNGGDVYITDTTKGIVLKSPDGTCYRFTVANGGTLSSGASITCP